MVRRFRQEGVYRRGHLCAYLVERFLSLDAGDQHLQRALQAHTRASAAGAAAAYSQRAADRSGITEPRSLTMALNFGRRATSPISSDVESTTRALPRFYW